MHVAVRVKSLGVLAHDHEIHLGAAVMGEAFSGPARADIGVKIERDSQLGRDVDAAFGPRWIIGMGDRAEQDAVRRTATLEHGGRKGRAAALEARKADLMLLAIETQFETAVQQGEDFERRGRNLRTDAVPRQYYDPHRPISRSVASISGVRSAPNRALVLASSNRWGAYA